MGISSIPAIPRVYFATRGFPVLFMGEKFAVYVYNVMA